MDVNTNINTSITSIDQISSEVDPSFIIVATDHKNIDPGFAYATWALETGYGTSDLWTEHNNPAGIKCGIEYCSYINEEEGYEAMFELLSEYTDCNLLTVDQVRSVWSETEDSEQIVSIWINVLGGN
ncbi:MAG: glucosaminidase domain-containing protein [Breznakia sp.]